jgi:hypothetical protein
MDGANAALDVYDIVAPEETADSTKIAPFRDWLVRSVTKISQTAARAG